MTTTEKQILVVTIDKLNDVIMLFPKNCEAEAIINNVPLHIISIYQAKTGEGEDAEENFSLHSRTEGDYNYNYFSCAPRKGITLNSVLFSPRLKSKKEL